MPGDDARELITAEIATRVARVPVASLRAGPIQRNYFSILFPVDGPGTLALMVKVPKTDLRARTANGILPLTDADRALGAAEYDGLRLMHDTWDGDDVRVRWVRPLDYLGQYNAIVTERVKAADVWPSYTAAAARRWRGDRAAGAQLVSSLERIGTALGRFHRRHGAPLTLDGARLAERVRHYTGQLVAEGLGAGLRQRLVEGAQAIAGRSWHTAETATFKGIDIRNVLESEDGTIWLLDPGKIKRAPAEADLSRFLMTWRILFWGTPWFAMARKGPHASIESGFLRGYLTASRFDPGLLDAYLIKEALKHWTTARESLALKAWPAATRSVVRRLYVDPFFRRQLHDLLTRIA